MPPSHSDIGVRIRGLAVGGDTVGEVVEGAEDVLGITAFLPYAAPGELVKARILSRKPRYLHAELLEIEEASAERVKAECQYYQSCGGCELQHLSYEAQLHWKGEMIRGALAAAKLPDEVLQTLRPVFPGQPYRYRQRIHLHITVSGQVGFYRPNSRAIVAIDSCAITSAKLSATIPPLQEFGRAVQGKLSSLLLEEDKNGVIAVLKSPYSLTSVEQQAVLKVARGFFESAILIVGGEEVGGFGRQILEIPLDAEESAILHVPAGSFSQVNRLINIELVRQTVQAFPTTSTRKGAVLDLYSGAGNFSLPFALSGRTVTAVEADKRLVSFGRQNAQRYRLERTLSFVESSVERYLKEAPQAVAAADLVVADPPRSGLGAVAGALTPCRQLALISCHLPSFVRDLRALTTAGFSPLFIQPFDMFAQTSYVEILCALRRE